MNKHKKNIAIAKACGWEWKWVHRGYGSLGKTYGLKIVAPNSHLDCRVEEDPMMIQEEFQYVKNEERFSASGKSFCLSELLDYQNDLNAMHEAEKFLQGEPGYHSERWAKYERELYKICKNINGFGPYHATSAQRAEAFLRTLNLWTEN